MKNYDDEFGRYGDEIVDAEIADEDEYDEVIDGEYAPGYERTGDQLGRVLDEIAELKRNIESENRNAGGRYRNSQSEAELYDEINRLRGELADTRRSQSMQEELNKLREQLDRESDEKNAKLVAEIEQLKSRLAEIGDTAEEEASDEKSKGATKTELDAISAELAVIKEGIASHRAVRHSTGESVRVHTDTTELMRRIIDIRLAIGKLSQKEYENDIHLLSVYNALTAAKSCVYTSASGLAEKLEAMRKLDNEIALSEDCYIGDVVAKYNEMASYILCAQAKREDLTVAAGLGRTDKIKTMLTPEGRAAAVKFMALAGAVKNTDNTNLIIDKAAELTELKNTLQCDRSRAYNDNLCAEIVKLGSDLAFMTETSDIEKCTADIHEKAGKLCSLTIGEIISIPTIVYDKQPYTVPAHSYVREAAGSVAVDSTGIPAEGTVNALTDAVNMLRTEISAAAIEEIGDMQRKIADTQVGNREAIITALNELAARLDKNEKDGRVQESSSPDELNLFLSEIVSLRDELQAYKDEVSNMADKLSGGGAVAEAGLESESSDVGALMDEIASIHADMNSMSDELGDVKTLLTGGAVVAGTAVANNGDFSDILKGIEEIKSALAKSEDDGDELLSVRDELMRELEKLSEEAKASQSGNEVLAGIEELKTQISDLRVYTAVGGVADSGTNMADELAALRAELAAHPTTGDIADVKSELTSLHDDVSAIKTDLATVDDMRSALASGDGASAAGMISIKEMLAALAVLPAAVADLKSDIAALRTEVEELKSSSYKAPVPANAKDRSDRTDELVEKIYGDVRLMCDEPDYSVMNEILALREEYQRLKESINKLLADPGRGDTDKLISEIDSLRDQIFTINMASVSDGETQTYESYNNLIIDSLNEIRDELRSVMQGAPISGDALATARLEKELRDQKETQKAIASLLNQTLDQIQKQGEMLRSNADKSNEAAPADDKSAGKQEELLSEIENIKYTLGVIQGNDKGEDADLEGSIAKLKKELSEVAGIINAEQQEKTTDKKKKSTKK